MRRRLLLVLAALPLGLSGCAPAPAFTATVTTAQNSWQGATWCDISATKGSAFDIEKVLLGYGSAKEVTVTFTLRDLPPVEQPSVAAVSFRNRSGTRSGVLVTRWRADGSLPTVSEIDRTTGRSRLLAARPVVDRRSGTISITYPDDLFGIGKGRWTWNADTYVRGEHVDNCTAHKRSLEETALKGLLP